MPSMKALTQVDEVTRKRIDSGEADYHLCLTIDGVRVGNTDKTR